MAEVSQTTELQGLVASAIREEIVRQYREDERGKCPAGAAFYEENVSPLLIAQEAIAVVRQWDAGK